MIRKTKIGITGQAGFIGTHLYNYLGLLQNVERIPFQDEYFQSGKSLRDFVRQCDVIVHLAAMNRHEDQQVIYKTNIQLVELLIDALEAEKVNPHVLISSSTQEDLNNPYGQSKKTGREMLAHWASINNASITGFIIPNVFGPFGLPFYNSVVATFSHQLTHNKTPEIHKDGELKLIYVGELVSEIWNAIQKNINIPEFRINHTSYLKVSELHEKLLYFKSTYLENGFFPKLEQSFDLNLFNTFRCYIDHQRHFPFDLVKHTDSRGSFVETVKTEMGGQFSFSTTEPGITRGNHYHTRKIERFAVIKGKAMIRLRRIGTTEVLYFEIDGNQPAFVDMPIWYTHNISNIGEEELFTLFWINEFYNSDDPDTYFEEV